MRRQGVVGAVITGMIASLSLTLPASAPASGQADSRDPTAIHLESYALSDPVRDLTETVAPDGGAADRPRTNPLASEPSRGRRGTRSRAAITADPLVASASHDASSRTPAPSLVFNGTANPFACGGCSPPDTIGDVGPNHYIQMVNATKVAIYNKSGTLLTPAFDLGTLFPLGDPCATDDGDPVVLYDPLADRWLLSQFRDAVVSTHLCFAISQTADPLGAYHTYNFTTPEFPDYFKVGVWPTGYYVSANESSYTAYAFDRTKMLAGDTSASGVRFAGETNFLLPADVDGPTSPADQGGIFYTFKDNAFHGGSDRLELFRLEPDFATPGNSTFSPIGTLPVASFAYTVCGFFVLDCIPQRGTTQEVDAVSEWPMHRFAYRRFADHEALVGNFAIGGGTAVPGSAIRWFELRDTGAGWTLFQEGTHDLGDGLNRFMGSIAMDQAGNIALGYSASNSSAFPSIRYATRAPGDPLGTMGPEQTLLAGGGSQLSSNRWGDYSAMSVDPADDCSFWYTNEYYNPSSGSNWKTAIGSFREPTCGTAPPPPPGPDSDGDGVPDAQDACPTQAGAGVNGCPPNDFTIGKTKRNKKKGTATVSVTVPGPGTLALTGKNLKPQRPSGRGAGGRRAVKPVAAAGIVKLKIKATGKAKRKLKKKGKAKVTAKITFTPTGGLAATQTKSVKLKKKRSR